MPVDLYRNPLSNALFVFGSNLAGRHGAGAAKFAQRFFHAEYGVGEGRTGNAYALPTKDARIQTLPMADVEWHCKQFLDYARRSRETMFQLTRVGCGLAGLRDGDIAPWFCDAPDNVLLPAKWLRLNKQLERARLLVFGEESDANLVLQRLAHNTATWRGRVEVVTMAEGVVAQAAREWATTHGYPWTPFPPDVEQFGAFASLVLNEQLGWYTTHALALQPGVVHQSLLEVLQREGVQIKKEAHPAPLVAAFGAPS